MTLISNKLWALVRLALALGLLPGLGCGEEVDSSQEVTAKPGDAGEVVPGVMPPTSGLDSGTAAPLDAGGPTDAGAPEAVTDHGDAARVTQGDDPVDVPVRGITPAELAAFHRGDELFGLPLRAPDGLGPLYTRDNCGGCHAEGVRGPGLVQKLSVVEADGLTPATDQSKLTYGHTVHPLVAGGAHTAITAPASDGSVRVTLRLGAPVIGRGYMEAVLDSEIERVASEQSRRDDDIHGRINHVAYASEENPDKRFHDHRKGDVLIGRFGLKARVATLDDFAADALQGDMGITSPLRPSEIVNPDGLLDDEKPGVDVSADSVNLRAMYTRLIAIPQRQESSSGARLFAEVQCAACHTPELRTRADYPIAKLADIYAAVYTDFLLHDMGDGLSDSLSEGDGEAGPRDWRTAPLIGLRFNPTFLHDGRAQTIAQAITAHDSRGSEASDSVQRFRALSEVDREALIAFVEGL
jgi:CxxC motif-containing protein (DUF1111 family)